MKYFPGTTMSAIIEKLTDFERMYPEVKVMDVIYECISQKIVITIISKSGFEATCEINMLEDWEA